MSNLQYLKEPSNFSLVLGGPLYQLFLRTRLANSALGLLRRRVIFISLFAWLPLPLLSAFEGQAFGSAIKVPFLYDIEVHARLLLALPLLIVAELVAHKRMRPIVLQFLDRGIVPEEALLKFEAIVGSAMRLRNSVVLEMLLIVFVLTVGHYLWSVATNMEQLAQRAATWYATVDDSGLRLSLAGYWYAYVSIPIFQFILLRWYFRLFIWGRFLWQVSRLDLRLIPIHPDRAAGLGFLGNSAFALTPLLLAHGVLLSGLIANRIFHEGAKLASFKLEIVGSLAFLMLVVLGPLCVFILHLMRAKRTGIREYGILASRYVSEFDQKWIRGNAPEGEPLVGSGDVQSLADLANSFEVIRGMRLFPFSKEIVVQLTLVTALPLLPLTLTMIPLEELITKLLGVVF